MKSIRVLLMLAAIVLLFVASTVATQIQEQIQELEEEDQDDVERPSYLDQSESNNLDTNQEEGTNDDEDEDEGEDFEAPTFLRGSGRLLLANHHKQRGHTHRKNNTCNKNPRICRASGSPGRSCCKKKCVNLLSDKRNCGRCGKKCKYSHICCNGKCVNPRSHEMHCGGCSNSCGSGQTCRYGMCSYADF